MITGIAAFLSALAAVGTLLLGVWRQFREARQDHPSDAPPLRLRSWLRSKFHRAPYSV